MGAHIKSLGLKHISPVARQTSTRSRFAWLPRICSPRALPLPPLMPPRAKQAARRAAAARSRARSRGGAGSAPERVEAFVGRSFVFCIRADGSPFMGELFHVCSAWLLAMHPSEAPAPDFWERVPSGLLPQGTMVAYFNAHAFVVDVVADTIPLTQPAQISDAEYGNMMAILREFMEQGEGLYYVLMMDMAPRRPSATSAARSWSQSSGSSACHGTPPARCTPSRSRASTARGAVIGSASSATATSRHRRALPMGRRASPAQKPLERPRGRGARVEQQVPEGASWTRARCEGP